METKMEAGLCRGCIRSIFSSYSILLGLISNIPSVVFYTILAVVNIGGVSRDFNLPGGGRSPTNHVGLIWGLMYRAGGVLGVWGWAVLEV